MKKIAAFLFLLCTTLSWAQFNITRIKPGKTGEHLCATVWMHGAFSIKIEETIRSGLPAMMDLRILLRDQSRKIHGKTTLTFQIQCDIWKEEYRVARAEQMRFYASFDSVKAYFATLHDLPVIEYKKLNPTERYQIWIQAEVMPISKIQSDQVKEWLVDSDEDAQLAGGQRDAGGHLSLSNLIVSVFSRGKKKELETGWIGSEFFVPASLP